MTRHESYDTHVYVEGRDRPLPVGMYTDEHSQVCSIRFSNSFTLNVVDPLMLETLICELQAFADAAHKLHYGMTAQRIETLGEEMAQLQQKLDDCGVGMNEFMEEQQINAARARYLREEADFDPSDEVARVAYEEMGGISRASVRGIDKIPTEPYVPVEQQPSKVERLMQGTVSAPEWNPSDPINW